MKLPWLFLVLYCLPGISQERIELVFDPGRGEIVVGQEKVRHGHRYTFELTGINSAHIALVSEVGSAEFISPLPELLGPIFTGIRDNSVFDVPGTGTGKRGSPYLHAVRSYNALEKLRSQGDALYRATRFSPDTALARAQGDQLLGELQFESLQQLSLEIENARYFTAAVLQNHSAQVEALGPRDPMAHAFLIEYATLRRIGDQLEKTDYAKALDFMLRSQTATDRMPVDGFRAERDVVDLKLEILDTYTGETLYQGTVSFATYGNLSFDFSTGLFYSDLVEHHYYRVPGNGETDRILREDTDPVDISVGALAHFVYKMSPALGAGIALGASLSPLDGHLRYLVGPSFMVGRQKLFSLSFGLALARLDRLSSGLPRDGEGPFLPAGEPLRTLKKMETGLFAGITYNLSRKRL